MAFHSNIPVESLDTCDHSLRGRSTYAGLPKRVFDLTLVLIALPVALPLIAFLMLLVALDGSSPIYRQRRLGLGGRIYHILKLRTMVPDADARLEAHLKTDPEARQEWDSLQKLHDDPRITRLGRFLRKTSLDELPQLWNVLKGEMSLIGPRPMMVDQAPLYPGRAYYTLRPGISGLWQVSNRNQSSFASRADFDQIYAETVSFKTDLYILARTVVVVLRTTGC